MQMSVIITQMAVLFIILAVGYGANKLKIMSAQTDKLISKLVLCITMPCTILNSVMSGTIELTGGEAMFFILMILVSFAIFFAVAIPFSRVLRCDKADYGLYSYMAAFGNVGFMGFPIAQSIFGDASAFFVALFNIPFTLLAFSVGIIMISGGKGKISFKVLINPSLITALAAFLIFLTGFKTPSVIAGSVKLISGMTTPCAMLVIGSTLAEIPLRNVFSEWRSYLVALIKLLIIPIITRFVLKQFINGSFMLNLLVVLSAMPTATTATMLAMQYDGNEKLASKGVFITTLFSVVTIPLVVFLLLS